MTRRTDSPPRTTWTVPEVATSLGVSVRHVYRMCESGEIRSIRAGNRVLIPVAVLEAFVNSPAVAAS